MGVIVAIDATRIKNFFNDPSLHSVRSESRILRDILIWSAHRVFTIPVGRDRDENLRIRKNYCDSFINHQIDQQIVSGVERELFKNARLNEARTLKGSVLVDATFRGNSLYFHLEE